MIVLLDLEWIGENPIQMTQLAAKRVREDWTVENDLNILFQLEPESVLDPKHMALGGVGIDEYRMGTTEQEAMQRLCHWLDPADEIWTWAKSNIRVLEELWTRWMLEEPLPKTRAIANKVRKKLAPHGYDLKSPYTILKDMNMTPPVEHNARNDTEALRLLLKKMKLQQTIAPETEELRTCRDVIQDIIDRTEYNYLFLNGSDVFHRRSCKACLNAKSAGDILGSIYYATAARQHRPCKLCKPTPYQENDAVEGDSTERPRLSLTEQRNEVIKARLLTDDVIPIKRKNILGWCTYKLHKGAINKALLEKHQCLKKNCVFLVKNDLSTYWAAQEQAAAEKKRRKEQAKQDKAKAEALQQKMLNLATAWQKKLDEMGSDMFIVPVERETRTRYRVFYVSDNSFADGNRFPEFVDMVRREHPGKSVNMRHIRDVDGHFVTREEFFHR